MVESATWYKPKLLGIIACSATSLFLGLNPYIVTCVDSDLLISTVGSPEQSSQQVNYSE